LNSFTSKLGKSPTKGTGSKKKLDLNYQDKLGLIDRENPQLSLRRQCDLLGISKSSIYYEHGLSEEEFTLMNRIDEIYTKRPFYGNRRITKILQNEGWDT
jgi:putative transposase